MCKKLMFLISLVSLLAVTGTAFSAERGDWVGDPCDPAYGTASEVELNWYTDSAWDPEGPPTCQARIHRDRTPSGPYCGPLIDSDVEIGEDCDEDYRPSLAYTGGGSTGDVQVSRIISGTVNVHDRIYVSHGGSDIPHTLIMEGDAVVNSLTGSSNSMRTGDKGGQPTVLVRGDSVFNVNGGWRAGDSGSDDGWVFVNFYENATVTVNEYMRLGDDRVGEFHFGGNASVEIGSWVGYNGRGGVDFGDMTVSGNCEIWVGDTFQVIGQKVDANCLMSGGSINCNNFKVAGGGAHGRLFMTGGLIVCRDQLQCPDGDAQADIQLDAGTIECAQLNLPSGGHIDITEGTLIVAGNKVAEIAQLVCEDERITGYGEPAGVIITYDADNDRTVVTARDDFDPEAAYCPDPANGAIRVRSAVTEVILKWKALTGNRDMFTIYFSTDKACVEARDPGCNVGMSPASRPKEWPVGNLPLWTTHYWAIDTTYYPGRLVPGEVWSFTTGCDPIQADFNEDCVANFKDFADVASTWQGKDYWP